MEDWEDEAAETLDRLTQSPMADAMHGTARVVALSDPKGRARYQSCELQLVLEAPGLAPEPLTTEVVLDRRYWPKAGMVLRASISRGLPRLIEVDWDALAR
jgi:hypothetical protein